MTNPAMSAESTVRERTYAEALNEAHLQAMSLSDDVIVLGQLVDYSPGVFGSTTGLVERFGSSRVCTPVA